MKRRSGRKSLGRTSKRAPRTAAQYNALPERSKDAYDKMIRVLSLLRADKKKSLTEASRGTEIDPRTAIRLAGSALKKVNGHYVAKPKDDRLRMLRVPTPKGVEEIGILGSQQATTLGEYWAAVHEAIRPRGDSSALAKFHGREIKDASGASFPLITDVGVLKDLARAGVLSFESLYARGA